MTLPCLSHHAEDRMKERLHIKSRSEQRRRCKLAFERGERAFPEPHYHNGVLVMVIIILYQGFRWIFSQEGCLITLYQNI